LNQPKRKLGRLYASSENYGQHFMSELTISIQGSGFKKSANCEPIIKALPNWFGQEEANQHYLVEMNQLPTFMAMMGGESIGFLTLKQHFPTAAEIYLTGVLPTYHRKGMGRALLFSAEAYLRAIGVQYLQVKTLSDSHPDEGYARTRAFYQAMGFHPLEEITTLWNESNPALVLIKKL
jgi:ribosomal protein S18 acetylase RimI-like enzyme